MAEGSVSEATWSITTRRGLGRDDPGTVHHVTSRDGLEQGTFEALAARDDEIGGVPGEGVTDGAGVTEGAGEIGVEGGLLGGDAEAADELAGQVLQGGHGAGAAVVGGGPDVQGEQRLEDLGELGFGYPAGAVSDSGAGNLGPFGLRFKVLERDEAGVEPVLHIVDRIGYVVSPVHDLGLQARPAVWRALPDPAEDLGVIGVGAELAGGRGGLGGKVPPQDRGGLGGSSP